ncbi:hypothetical protein T261_6851 [Streptomyces lydicus]|nr:hypothetical protein T261_6851 [Streptomyces lydicus]
MKKKSRRERGRHQRQHDHDVELYGGPVQGTVAAPRPADGSALPACTFSTATARTSPTPATA